EGSGLAIHFSCLEQIGNIVTCRQLESAPREGGANGIPQAESPLSSVEGEEVEPRLLEERRGFQELELLNPAGLAPPAQLPKVEEFEMQGGLFIEEADPAE
ncbi:unnamed protein product, partial [Symbiodinium sp. KB8]